MRRSLSSTSTSTCSASGITSTPAAEVCTRPCDSVTGTRWTRCTPPSNFSRAYGASPGSAVPSGLDRRGDGLVAAEVGLGGVEHLDAPAAGLGVAGVHPQQVAGEERGLLAALPRLDLEQRVLAVGGVAGHQQAAQPLTRGVAPLGEVVGLLGEGGVVGGQLARRLDVVAEAEPLLPGRHDGRQLGVALVELLGEALVGVGLGERRGVARGRRAPRACPRRLRTTLLLEGDGRCRMRTDDKAPATRGERETGA